MVKEIRVYVEGDRQLKPGFDVFFKQFVEMARRQRIRWRFLPSGNRFSTYEDFQTSLHHHPEAFHILLVDSEAPVITGPWIHLRTRDRWDNLGLDDDH